MSVLSEPQCRLAMPSSWEMTPKLPYYPIHESVKDLLHEDYRKFYHQHLLHAEPAHLQPIEVTRRGKGTLGSSLPLPVGSIQETSFQRQQNEGPSIRVRSFTPDGGPPAEGWPVMLYFHGGGWVLGDIDSENNICTQMCVRSRCVVLTVEYRLAPENPFPAAIDDAWESLLWTSSAGARILNLDIEKIAVGGASAGANLAAVIANRSAKVPSGISIRSQLLVVPVLDNTALPCNNPTYRLYEHTAALSTEKMLWYRNHYLPRELDRYNPDASPIFFLKDQRSMSVHHPSSGDLGSNETEIETTVIPPALLILGGCDILCHEGELYGQLLRERGIRAEVHVMQGMPHPFLALDTVLEAGRTAITLLCTELNRVFHSS